MLPICYPAKVVWLHERISEWTKHSSPSSLKSSRVTSESKPSLKLNCETLLREIIQAVTRVYEKWTHLRIDVLISRFEKHLFITEELAQMQALLALFRWQHPSSFIMFKFCFNKTPNSMTSHKKILIKKSISINFMTRFVFLLLCLHNSAAILMVPIIQMDDVLCLGRGISCDWLLMGYITVIYGIKYYKW